MKLDSGTVKTMASQEAKAKAFGFRPEIPLYHGSQDSFQSFRTTPTHEAGWELPGVSAAENPELADEFAYSGPASEFAVARRGSDQSSPQVYKLWHRADNPTSLTLDGTESHHQVVGTLRDTFDAGYDSVRIKNYTSPGGLRQQKFVVVLDESIGEPGRSAPLVVGRAAR